MERKAADISQRIRAEENAVMDVQFALLDLLREAGVSKKELAERLNISKSAVSQLFAAGANPTAKQLARIFDALDHKLVLKSVPLRNSKDAIQRASRDEIRVPEGFLRARLAAATYIEWESSSPANENYGEQQRAVA